MNTDRIYRVALVYAQHAGIETTAANMERIISGMLAELRPLAEEYGAEYPGAARTSERPRAVAQVAEDYVFFLRSRDDGTRWPVGTKLYALEEPHA